jgi:quinol monooxygenase YgiN
MAVRQVITFRARPGRGDDIAAGFAPIIAAVRTVEGCEHYELFRGVDDPDTLIFVERWRDEAALEEALRRHFPGRDHPSLAFLQHLDGAPIRERYEV